jgi:mersacidin/lichenicidin family type 2 lantibiotic
MNSIVRAWKDEAYRQGLSVEEQAMLPANPAGEIELTDAELEAISGGCNFHHREEPTVKVKQEAENKAAATYVSAYVVAAPVYCNISQTATNTATVKPSTDTGYDAETFGYWY